MTDRIIKTAEALTRRCDTHDPFLIAKQLGVHILLEDGFSELKGMYIVIKRSRFIVVNPRLDRPTQRIVCAHELGHDALHRAEATGKAVQDTALFNNTSRMEYEANLFAAHLLLSSYDVLVLARSGNTVRQIAARLHTDENLVALVVDSLIADGYALNSVPHKNNILR